MKLQTSLVAVKKIESDVARSSFSAEAIEQVAQLMIQAEGTINPIILKRTSLESYQVVDGHFEYYAAVRAREMSPLKGEMIQAIILEPENEEVLLAQVNLLRKGSIPELESGGDADLTSSLEPRFANLEKVFRSQFEELRKDNRNLERSINEMAGRTSDVQTSGLTEESIRAIAEKVAEVLRPIVSRSATSGRSSKRSIEEFKQHPVDLNSASVSELSTVPGIGDQKAVDIVKRRETKGYFTSVEELTEIKGIAKSTIDRHRWRECFVIHGSSA
jgi:competence ComEA-like helix-hairpin-helix protein